MGHATYTASACIGSIFLHLNDDKKNKLKISKSTIKMQE